MFTSLVSSMLMTELLLGLSSRVHRMTPWQVAEESPNNAFEKVLWSSAVISTVAEVRCLKIKNAYILKVLRVHTIVIVQQISDCWRKLVLIYFRIAMNDWERYAVVTINKWQLLKCSSIIRFTTVPTFSIVEEVKPASEARISPVQEWMAIILLWKISIFIC